MSIETIGGTSSILKNAQADKWVQKADLQSTFSEFNLPGAVAPKKSFMELLADSVNEVNELQREANTSIEKLASGQSKNIHETLLAVEQADIAFKTMNQVRQKVLDAYKEVMRMQI